MLVNKFWQHIPTLKRSMKDCMEGIVKEDEGLMKAEWRRGCKGSVDLVEDVGKHCLTQGYEGKCKKVSMKNSTMESQESNANKRMMWLK